MLIVLQSHQTGTTTTGQNLLQPGVGVGWKVQCHRGHTHFALSPWTILTDESHGWSHQICSGTRAGGNCPPSRSDPGPGSLSSPLLPVFSPQKYTQWPRVNLRILQTLVQIPAVFLTACGTLQMLIRLPVKWARACLPCRAAGRKEIMYVTVTPGSCQRPLDSV